MAQITNKNYILMMCVVLGSLLAFAHSDQKEPVGKAQGYLGQNLKLQEYIPGVRTVQITIESLPEKKYKLTYQKILEGQARSSLPISQTTELAVLRVPLDMIFQASGGVESWQTDLDCFGKTTWLIEIAERGPVAICNSSKNLQTLNRMLMVFSIILQN
jgi:hypothetical protein